MKRVILMTAAMMVYFTAMAAEEPKYKVIVKDEYLEVRDYEPYILAEVVISNTMTKAGSEAFRPLFKYISGDNSTDVKIPMTSPVSLEKASRKIPMTSPVSQEKSDDGWAVSFMMPAAETLKTLPKPDNKNIKLRVVPARRMAAVQYSGKWSQKNYDIYLKELEAWIKEKELKVSGKPVWARYDPPFKPWPLRRNEILIPIEKPKK